MIFDIALFCLGIGLVLLLGIPGRTEKDTIPHFIKTNLPGSGLVSGGLITVIKLLVLVSSFEQLDLKQNDISFTQLLIMVFVNLRPLLFGVLLRLVFMPFGERLAGSDAQVSPDAVFGTPTGTRLANSGESPDATVSAAVPATSGKTSVSPDAARASASAAPETPAHGTSAVATQNPAHAAKTEPSAPGTQVCKPSPTTLLSRRELEVARLAAKGWTNSQIADQLFISVATVKRHLATIFEKLQISSRRDLSNWFAS